jgi:3-hydroxybutyrate dehydrogenase
MDDKVTESPCSALYLSPHLFVLFLLSGNLQFQPYEMSDVSGKVVLVTGAAGGLGEAIAESFVLAASKVVIVDINLERLNATETELSVRGDVLALAVDVTDEDAVKGMMFATFENFGKLDVVSGVSSAIRYIIS